MVACMFISTCHFSTVRQIVHLEDINALENHDDNLMTSLYGHMSGGSTKSAKADAESKKTHPKWTERARNYSCNFCWKTFVVKRDWEGHVNSIHLKAKPFKCHICSWSSSHRGELQKHIKKCASQYGQQNIAIGGNDFQFSKSGKAISNNNSDIKPTKKSLQS